MASFMKHEAIKYTIFTIYNRAGEKMKQHGRKERGKRSNFFYWYYCLDGQTMGRATCGLAPHLPHIAADGVNCLQGGLKDISDGIPSPSQDRYPTYRIGTFHMNPTPTAKGHQCNRSWVTVSQWGNTVQQDISTQMYPRGQVWVSLCEA